MPPTGPPTTTLTSEARTFRDLLPMIKQEVPFQDGVYLDVPFSQYEQIEAAHATTLKTIVSATPAHARYEMLEPKDSDALAFGAGFHCAVLEPALFPKRYVLWPVEKGNRAGAKWDEFKAANAGREILREKDYDQIQEMAERIRNHPAVQQMLARKPLYKEVTLIWTDGHTGLRCRARADIFADDEAPSVIDYKTVAAAHPRGMANAIVEWGWDVQAAFYCQGVRTLRPGAMLPNFIIPAIEKTGSYECGVYRLDRVTMRLGWMRARHALDIYAECQKKREWPGYPLDVSDITAPFWALKQYGIELPHGENG